MRVVLLMAEASEDLEAARDFYNEHAKRHSGRPRKGTTKAKQ